MKLCEFDLDRAQARRGLSPYTLDTTARFHRTLQSAFGPYTSPHIIETRPRSRAGEIAYGVLLFVALAAVGVLLAWRG